MPDTRTTATLDAIATLTSDLADVRLKTMELTDSHLQIKNRLLSLEATIQQQKEESQRNMNRLLQMYEILMNKDDDRTRNPLTDTALSFKLVETIKPATEVVHSISVVFDGKCDGKGEINTSFMPIELDGSLESQIELTVESDEDEMTSEQPLLELSSMTNTHQGSDDLNLNIASILGALHFDEVKGGFASSSRISNTTLTIGVIRVCENASITTTSDFYLICWCTASWSYGGALSQFTLSWVEEPPPRPPDIFNLLSIYQHMILIHMNMKFGKSVWWSLNHQRQYSFVWIIGYFFHITTYEYYTTASYVFGRSEQLSYLDVVNENGVTALYIPVNRGHIKMVKELLKCSTKDGLAFRNRSGYDDLRIAARQDHLAIVQVLVGYDQSLSCSTGPSNTTPLISAATKGHTSIVNELLSLDCTLFEMHIMSFSSVPGAVVKLISTLRTRFSEGWRNVTH